MSSIWRFYQDAEQQWRWQRLAATQEVLEESPAGFGGYEQCRADAVEHGYVYLPSQLKAAPGRSVSVTPGARK